LADYNLKDVGPLATAMENAFAAFHQYFEQDPNTYLSLPSIASKALYRAFDQNCSYVFSFAQQWNEIRQKHRKTLVGGLVNVFHRYINLTDNSGPVNSYTSGNGERFTHFQQLDFNALYGM